MNIKIVKRTITKQGTKLIKKHYVIYHVDQAKSKTMKDNIKCKKEKQFQETLLEIKASSENHRFRIKLLDTSTEPASYIWLTTISSVEQIFCRDKLTFWDIIFELDLYSLYFTTDVIIV